MIQKIRSKVLVALMQVGIKLRLDWLRDWAMKKTLRV